ncbi:MAG: hypothetical protein MZV70_63390 [Desulfobacterales bacterium]|nr:hypothetical protein [Desulfobacterales bacterium]
MLFHADPDTTVLTVVAHDGAGDGNEAPTEAMRRARTVRSTAQTTRLPGAAHRGGDAHVDNRQTAQQGCDAGTVVPTGAGVGAGCATRALLQVQQAVAIEQAEREAPARDAGDFAEGLALVCDEAQRGDRRDAVEAPVGKRQGGHVGHHAGQWRRNAGAGECRHAGAEVRADDRVSILRKATGEIGGAAAGIQNRFAGSQRQLPAQPAIFGRADPAPARRSVPGVVSRSSDGIDGECPRCRSARR